jgi:hypothetical protein
MTSTRAVKKKVFIIGLPKSGTSTLSTMLRILGYKVTGPNPYLINRESLIKIYDKYEVFQDYPWCFEYPILLKREDVKIILLKREKEPWSKSFKDSYGGENENYLSFKYMKLSKNLADQYFYDYHTGYYKEALDFLIVNNFTYLEVSLINLDWKSICDFLNKPIPKNIFGMVSKIPKVNTKNYKKKVVFFKFKKQFKKKLHTLLGKYYFKLTSFIYKNR